MAFLTVNGVTIPAKPPVGVSHELIGENRRSYLGDPVSSVRAVKRQWSVTTKPMSYADAQALIGLVCGLGDCWSFDSDQYSGKGAVARAQGGSGVITVDGTTYKYGGGSLKIALSGASTWWNGPYVPVNPGDVFTMFGWAWSNLSDTNSHLYLAFEKSDYSATATNAYQGAAIPNGSAWNFLSHVATAPSDAAWMFLEVATSALTGDIYVDDFGYVPGSLTSAELSAIEAHGVAFTPPPDILVEGDMVGSEAVTCRATLTGSQMTRFINASGLQPAGQTLTFLIQEN